MIMYGVHETTTTVQHGRMRSAYSPGSVAFVTRGVCKEWVRCETHVVTVDLFMERVRKDWGTDQQETVTIW